MSLREAADAATSYVNLDLFQPPTAHRAEFVQALENVVDKIAWLIPRFGLRNPRIGIAGTNRYHFCTEDEWVASFWPGQLWLAYSLTGQAQLQEFRPDAPCLRAKRAGAP